MARIDTTNRNLVAANRNTVSRLRDPNFLRSLRENSNNTNRNSVLRNIGLKNPELQRLLQLMSGGAVGYAW